MVNVCELHAFFLHLNSEKDSQMSIKVKFILLSYNKCCELDSFILHFEPNSEKKKTLDCVPGVKWQVPLTSLLFSFSFFFCPIL